MGKADAASSPAMKFRATVVIRRARVLAISPLASPPALSPSSIPGGRVTPGWLRYSSRHS